MNALVHRLRANPAMGVACLALFVALGGASYAAVNLPANSVGSKQLKKNAVVTRKVKDRTLLANDFKAGQLPAGATGPRGPAGSPDTPLEVRQKLAQVDGTGSGLSADEIDGLDSNAFAREIFFRSTTYNPPSLAQGSCSFTSTAPPAGTLLDTDSLVVSAIGLDRFALQVTSTVTDGALYAVVCNNGQFGTEDAGSFRLNWRVIR